MPNEALILSIAIDGKDAMKQVDQIVKDASRKLGGIKIDFSGKSIAGGGVSGFAKGMREASRKMKEETRQFRTEVEANLRQEARSLEKASREREKLLQRTMAKEEEVYRRLANHMRVQQSRAARGGAFNPMAPFMDARLSGRGLTGRARNALMDHKRLLDQTRRDMESVQRDKEKMAKDFARRNAKNPLTILSGEEVDKDQKAAWWARLSESRRLQEEQQKQTSATQQKLMSAKIRQSFRNQKENEREQLRVDRANRQMSIARQRQEEAEQKRYIRSQSSLAKQRLREDENLRRQMTRDSDMLSGSILNPQYHTQGTLAMRPAAQAQMVWDNIKNPKLARAAQANRSSYLASLAQQGIDPRGFMGPVPKMSGQNPNAKAISKMFGNAGVTRAEDMRRLNQRGKGAGMGLMGLYQLQQMYEDYQYAGIRGLGNNAAFLGASIGGPVGAGIIGATFAMQLGEMTYKMLGYADAQEKAAKASAMFTENQLRMLEVTQQVRVGFATGEARTEEDYNARFENPAKRTARKAMEEALIRLQSNGKTGVEDMVAMQVQSNPRDFLKYASGLGEDVPGMYKSLDIASSRRKAATSSLSLMESAAEAQKNLEGLRMAFADSPSPEDMKLLKDAEVGAAQAADKFRKSVLENFPETWKDIREKDVFASNESISNARSALEAVVAETTSHELTQNTKIEEVVGRLLTGPGARSVAKDIMSKAAGGDLSAFEIVKPFAESNPEVKAVLDEAQRVVDAEKDAELYAERRKEHLLNIRDAESQAERLMRSQLSIANDMVDAQKRKATAAGEAKTRSSDSFAARAFGVNRSRTSDFLEMSGAPDWYIQQQDDMIVQARLSQLRGSANAAGKAGDVDRQIEMLKELQDLQMQMASTDSRFGVAQGFYNASFSTQAEIEAAYQKQVNTAQQQQQAWAGIVNGLQKAQSIKIDPMSPDALPKLQQYLVMLKQAQAAMIGLNPAIAGQFGQASAGLTQGIQNVQQTTTQMSNNPFGQAQYDLFGGFARGGMIHGQGRNDTVNARLMPHEYVIKADVVKRLGAATFDQINRTGRLPRMAQGGLAGNAGMPDPELGGDWYFGGSLGKNYGSGDLHFGPEAYGLPIDREVRRAHLKIAREKEKNRKRNEDIIRKARGEKPFDSLIQNSDGSLSHGVGALTKKPPELQDGSRDWEGTFFNRWLMRTGRGHGPWPVMYTEVDPADPDYASFRVHPGPDIVGNKQVREAQKQLVKQREERRRQQAEGMAKLPKARSPVKSDDEVRIARQELARHKNGLTRANLTPEQQAQLRALEERREATEYLKKMYQGGRPKMPKFTMSGVGSGYKPVAMAANRGGRARPRSRHSGYNYGMTYSNPWGADAGWDEPNLFGAMPVMFQGGTMMPPLFMAAPVIGNRTFNGSGGFADRLLHGNYSGDQNNIASWWATLSSKRFANMGGSLGHGVRSLAGVTGMEDMSWLGRGYRNRRRMRGGLHMFAQGGYASPVFATPGYEPPIHAYTGNRTGSHVPGSGSSNSVNNTTNRSTIGAINIHVTGSGGAAQVVNDARRAEYSSRLRRG